LVTDGATNALTDGINVVFEQQVLETPPPCYICPAIGLFTDVESTLVTPADATSPNSLTPGSDYMPAGGWVVFRKRGPDRVLRVMRRAPQGTIDQPGIWTAPSQIDSMNPNGEVMLFNNGHERYAAPPGTVVPKRISYAFGQSFWLDPDWYVVIGPGVFRVEPASQADASVPEAGADTASPADADARAMDAPASSDVAVVNEAALDDGSSSRDAQEFDTAGPDASNEGGERGDAAGTTDAESATDAESGTASPIDAPVVTPDASQADAGSASAAPQAPPDDSGCALRPARDQQASSALPFLALVAVAAFRRARPKGSAGRRC
jgi:hypothetical protein